MGGIRPTAPRNKLRVSEFMIENVRVFGIVVAYQPDQARLVLLLRTLKAQCERIVLVCNSPVTPSADLTEELRSDQVELVTNNENLGIGAAQNIGIECALAQGASHVAIFDQDSMPDDTMIERLVMAEIALTGAGVMVAAVGPRLVDERTGAPGAFISFSGLRKMRLRPLAGSPPMACFSLLASGTLFRRESLEVIGLMNPGLFLEYVDVEWGARARSKGYVCYGVPAATLHHNLGDSRFRLPRGLTVPFHRPVRHYYTMRNAVFMQRQGYVPAYWKINDIIRTVAGFFIYSLFNPPRLKQLVMMTFGIADGLAGVSGPFVVNRPGRREYIRRLLTWASA